MTPMNQGWLVARREMRERARSRGFRISTLLMLIVVIVIVVLPGLLDTSEPTKYVGVSGARSQLLEQALTSRGGSGTATVRVRRYGNVAAGEKALRDEHVDVLVVGARRLEWRGRPDVGLQARVVGAVQVMTVRERAAASGLDAGTLARLLTPVPVETVQIGTAPGRSTDDETAAALMTVVLLTAIIIYGNLVLTGVVEEKSSRVVEVLLARLPAKALLGGKVVGIGLLGLGQLAFTALAALLASMVVDSVDLPAVTSGVLAWVLVWFVLGYALYAMLYGALGSLASRTEDAQAVAGPVGYFLVAGYWVSFLAISADPDGPWARVLSLLPPTAPLAMPGRIALGATTWWEPLAAVVLTLVTIAGLVSFAGRVYRNAVLHTGAALHLRDAWHSAYANESEASSKPRLQLTGTLTSPRKPMIWTIVLTTAGALTAAVIFTFTHDVIWTAVALLLSIAAVRRVWQQRRDDGRGRSSERER